MGDVTGIAWTDRTYNPWQGCTKVSPGCALCYMYREKTRYGQDPTTVVRSKPRTFNAPLRWKDQSRVFVCSWSDFFHSDADMWREEAWAIMKKTPHLIYQLCTKRVERVASHLPSDWDAATWSHVWPGFTAENQECFDQRAPLLLAVPAKVHWVSIEPMLGSIRLRGIGKDRLNWVVCGAESGSAHRETKLEWVRDLRDQCVDTGVPFFLKQLWFDDRLVITPELDGRQWLEFPSV